MLRRTAAAILLASAAYLAVLACAYIAGGWNIARHHVETAAYLFAAVALTVAVARSPRRPTESTSQQRLLLTAAVVAGAIAASVLLYANTLRLGFFSDDFVLAGNALAGRWMAGEFVRPFPSIVRAMVLRSTASDVALHALSIALHGVNTALVGFVAGRLGLPRAVAVAAALLFLVFPSSVETVAWPAALQDLILASCTLLFVLLAAGPTSVARVLLAIVVLVVGLLSKEAAVVIPMLAAVMWLDSSKLRNRTTWPILVAGVVVCVCYAAIRLTTREVSSDYAQRPTRYLAKELIARPIGTLSLPWTTPELTMDPFPIGAATVALVAVFAVYAWRADKLVPPSTIARCLVAAIAAGLPAYSLLFIADHLENSRYIYSSTAFWAIALAGCAGTMLRSQTWVPILATTAACALGVAGVQWHIAAWRTAADVRDRVLVAAETAMSGARCQTVSLAGAPDTVDGAYIFRNGLAEAVSRRTGWLPSLVGEGCTYVWTGSTFEKATSAHDAVQATLTRGF